MTEIINKLPRCLQIECMKYLITPNERIILIGVNGVGKKSFIRKCKNEEFQQEYIYYYNYKNKANILNINQRIKIAILSGLWNVGFLENKILKLLNQQLPTRMVFMASVISSVSLRQIYQCYIPLLLNLYHPFISKSKFKIDIILTNTDHPRYTWRELELRTLKRKLKEVNIDSLYYVSNKTGAGFENKYFESFYNEF